jgi:sec-independent protein translocase protein TatA
MPFGIGTQELIIFLVIVLLIFGPKNLPKLARSMGRAVRDFKTGISGLDKELEAEEEAEAVKETAAEIEQKEPIYRKEAHKTAPDGQSD